MTPEPNGLPVVFIDTPGLVWQPSEEEGWERRHALDVLLRNKGRIDRLKDPRPAVSCIVSRAETEDLMVSYGLPAFSKGDVDAFLMGIARAQGLIKKVSQFYFHLRPLFPSPTPTLLLRPPTQSSGWKPGRCRRRTHRLA